MFTMTSFFLITLTSFFNVILLSRPLTTKFLVRYVNRHVFTPFSGQKVKKITRKSNRSVFIDENAIFDWSISPHVSFKKKLVTELSRLAQYRIRQTIAQLMRLDEYTSEKLKKNSKKFPPT